MDPQPVSGEDRAPDHDERGVGNLVSCQATREQIGLRVDEEPLGRAVRGNLVAFRERVNDLPHRGCEGRSESEDLLAAPRASREQSNCFVVVEPSELGPESRQQGEPTVPTAFCVDRDTCCGKSFDVAEDRARGDLELVGYRLRGQPTPLAQQQHQRHQPVSPHGPTLPNT